MILLIIPPTRLREEEEERALLQLLYITYQSPAPETLTTGLGSHVEGIEG